MSSPGTLTFFKLCIAYFLVQSAVAYENAYDLLERRNSRFYEPRYFHSTTHYDNANLFHSQNRNPLGLPTRNPHFTKFGNGYDNLGNGIPVGHFHPFRHFKRWQLERSPFLERSYNNFDFGYPERSPQILVNHRSGGYHHSFHTSRPSSDDLYKNEFGSRGNVDFIKVDRVHEDNQDKKQKKADEFYQRNQEGIKADSLRKEKTEEQLRTDQMGENKSSSRSNKAVKKSRTTKGFAVHHHKDETGNSTTFFDETSDFGGQSDFTDIADGFDSRKTLEQLTRKGDEKYLTGNEGQTADYVSGLLLGNKRFEKDYSSMGGHEKSAGEFQPDDNPDLSKTYQYLNGDRFEYSDPHIDNYY